METGIPGWLSSGPENSPAQRWFRDYAARHGYTLDAAQTRVVSCFEGLSQDLALAERSRNGLLARFKNPVPVQGLYLWGGVGRGKTFLMDGFFQWMGAIRKERRHFHRFMQEIHQRLRTLRGCSDPLLEVSREISQRTRLLCLDEMHITDIGDAMLMRRLLEGFFQYGVALVTTSNQIPDDLYKDGLQRGQFLPAIDLLKIHLEVIHLDGKVDYRLRTLEKAGVYHTSLDVGAEAAQEMAFQGILGEEGRKDAVLSVQGRSITAKRVGPGVVWLEFAELCDSPRSQADYIELARNFHTVLISNIPRFGPDDGDRRRRFTWLVDEFYDRRVKVILSAAAPPHDLCPAAKPGSEFDRTASRLVEMQSREYLSQAHLA